jgi:general secretion pathway protein H
MIERRPGHGFSLVEILVVIVIVAIVSSVALLSLGLLDRDRELETQARRLVSLVDIAQDEAMMQGREFGIEFTIDGYRFVEYDPWTRQWSEVIDDELFRRRTLPEDFEFDLFLEGKRILLEAEAADIEAPDDEASVSDRASQYAPHLLIFSSGDASAFELHISRPASDEVISLEGDISGAIEFAENEG